MPPASHVESADSAPGVGRHAEAGGRLAVDRLALSDFRCFTHVRVAVDGRPVVLTGANGAGKTALLEAVSLLGPGRGLRNARLSEITRHGASGGWAVAATLSNPGGGLDMPGGRTEIGTGLAPPAGNDAGRVSERRAVRVDGESVRGTAALARLTAITWLTPQMDRLFNEGAAPRRRFLDRLVYGFDGDHARRVTEYDKAMRERARLLSGGGASGAWLAAIEETMASRGVAIAGARRAATRRLTEALAQRGGPFPRASLEPRGDVEDSLEGAAPEDAEAAYRTRLRGTRGSDAVRGTTAQGPHRSDLEVRHLVTGRAAAQGSTGEQKALLTAIVLANARLQGTRFGAAPLVLLDEVAAHLDARHREALFEEIVALGGQAWLSGVERQSFAALDGSAQFVELEDGRIAERGPA